MTTLPRPLADARRRWFGLLVLVGFGQAVAAVAAGILTGVFISRLVAPAAGFWQLGVALLGCAVLAAWLSRAEVVLAERLGQDYAHAIRLALFTRLALGPDPRRGSTGVMVLRFVGDLSALRLWASRGLARLAVAVPLVAGCLTALVVLHPVVGAPVAAVVGCGLAGTLWRGRALRELTRQARRRRGQLAARITDRVAHLPVVRAFGRGADELRRIDRKGRQLRDAVVARSRVIGMVRGLAELTGAVAVAVALCLAALTGAQPVVATTALMIAGVLVTPLRDLARVVEYRQAAVVARAKIEPILAGAGPGDVSALPPGRGEFVIECVFGDDTVVAAPGQVIAVAGADRQELLAIAAGLRSPERGRVLLDGRELGSISEQDRRTAIGADLPDLPLLRGTVAENLAYRVPDAPGDELTRVRVLTELDDVLDPDGRIGDGGSGLSAVQRARLTFARALVGRPRLLVLDEPPADLIDRVTAGCTVLIGTRDVAGLDHADQVWRLDQGRLHVVRPSHRDLIQRSSGQVRLWA